MPPPTKLTPADLAIIRGRAGLSDEGNQVIADCATVLEAITALSQGGHLIEASRLIAHAMPKREAVWWACMCARATQPATLAPLDAAALEAAELWVRKPGEDARYAAFALAQEAGFGSPEAWACVGAFWSGDSMAPVGQPAVPPAPNLAGTAIAGSIALASVRTDPTRQMARLQAFLTSAHDIAAGGTGRLPPETA